MRPVKSLVLLFVTGWLTAFTGTCLLSVEPLEVDETVTHLKLTRYMEYVEDAENRLTIDDIRGPGYSARFQAVGKWRVNFGYSRSTYWLRFRIYNVTGDAIKWYLRIWGDADQLAFYYPTGPGDSAGNHAYGEMESGCAIPFKKRPVDSFSFSFPVESQPGVHTYYIRLKSENSIVFYPGYLTPEWFQKIETTFFGFSWFLFGLIFALVIYNTFIYFSAKDKSYLYLALFIFFIAMMLYHEMGFVKWRFDVRSPFMVRTFLYLSMVLFLHFTRNFLNTERYLPKLDRILRYFYYILPGVFVISHLFGTYYASQLGILSAISVLLAALAAGILSLLKKAHGSKYYMVSSSLFLVGLLLTLIDSWGILPMTFPFMAGALIGFIFMILLFSLGITAKIKAMRSERIEALAALQKSEKQLRSIFENASEGIFQLAPKEMKLLSANPAMAEIFGYETLENLLKCTHFHERFDPEARDKIKQEVRDKGFVKGLEIRAFRTDGQPIYVSINSHPVRDSAGNILYIAGFMRDITERKTGEKLLHMAKEDLEKRVTERTAELSRTNEDLKSEIAERKRAETALKQSEEQHRQLIETMNEGFAIVDTNGILTYANPRLKDMFGYGDEEDLVGRRVTGFVDEKNREILLAHMSRRAAGEKSPYEIQWLRKNGESFTCIVSPQPIFDCEGNFQGSSAVLTDITAMKGVEAQHKQARDAAEHANRAKSEFLANMSHEIRTPLNSVLGFTDLLSGLVSGDKPLSYLEAIKASGKNLLMLINDILDLSRIEAGRLELRYEALNPHTLFNEMKNVFSLRIEEKGLDLKIEVADDIPESLLLDEVRLRQILFNLMGNAVKFTESGFIKLAARKVYTREDHSSLDLIVSVEDSGVGIPMESRRTIFDAFKQQDGQSTKKYGGTGLGLAITRRLVEMMEGEISLESEVGKGSVFEITFHDVAVAATTAGGELDSGFPDYASVTFEPAQVLVVDDVEPNRVLVREFLLQKDFSVIEAENGQKAVEMARQYKPGAILMDIRMPVMDGRMATAEIKKDEELKDIPIIALTASAMKGDRERILEEGFDGFLQKPVQAGDLFAELARFLAHTAPPGVRDREAAKAKKSRFEGVGEETGLFRILVPVDPDRAVAPGAEARLPEVLEQLEGPYMAEWEQARENGFFNEIRDFGRSLAQMGAQDQLPMLQSYGSALVRHVDSFDVENMNTLLRGYPRLIEQLKSAGNGDDEGKEA